jgi:hypothetical protein
MILMIFRPGAFLLALICFTLPFLRVSCKGENSTKEEVIYEAKGYQLAFGYEKVKSNAPVKLGDNDIFKDSDIPRQPLMLSAFIVLVMGLLVSILRIPYQRIFQVLLGLATVVLFIFFYFHYQSEVNNSEDIGAMKGKGKFIVTWLYGFWLSGGFALLALVLAIVPGTRYDSHGNEIGEESPETMEIG